MHFCYIDESGTPEIPGNTSHFILAGISIPVWHWKDCEREVEAVKTKHDLAGCEIHTGWILRSYLEQSKIPGFDTLSKADRASAVQKARTAILLSLQKSGSRAQFKQTKKNFEKTRAYSHLTRAERNAFIRELCEVVAGWGFARLFAECVDKTHFDPTRSRVTVDEQSFEQVVSRFEYFLQITEGGNSQQNFGVLVHDNNLTVAKKHTLLMKEFHKSGTFWGKIKNIIETPFFVDSELTGMIQIADLCAYVLRRYLENHEAEYFDLIFQRADRRGMTAVGVRHFTNSACGCKICLAHRSRTARTRPEIETE